MVQDLSLEANGHTQTGEPQHGFATRAIHVGSEPALSASSGVNTAIEMSTTYAQVSEEHPAQQQS